MHFPMLVKLGINTCSIMYNQGNKKHPLIWESGQFYSFHLVLQQTEFILAEGFLRQHMQVHPRSPKHPGNWIKSGEKAENVRKLLQLCKSLILIFLVNPAILCKFFLILFPIFVSYSKHGKNIFISEFDLHNLEW